MECELGHEVPDDMFVLHSCDEPECINPKHLSIGTPKENTQDMIRSHYVGEVRSPPVIPGLFTFG